MTNLKLLLATFIAIIAIACSKENTTVEPNPTPINDGFVAKLVEQPRKGHYIYTLNIQKGSQFNEGEYTLEVNMNGAKGSVLINGVEYTAPVKIDPYTVKIGYLPFSAGSHNIGLKIKNGVQSFTPNIKFENVTALWVNERKVVWGSQREPLAVKAGEQNELLEGKYFNYFIRDGEISINTLKTGAGEEYIYTCFNGIWTGVKVIVEEYVPLEFIIMEVNGTRIDQNTGVVEIEDIAKKTMSKQKNTIKIIDIYPKNASNSNPCFIIYASENFDIINKTYFENRKDKTYEFGNKSNYEDKIPFIHIVNEPNESGDIIIPLWKWKK